MFDCLIAGDVNVDLLVEGVVALEVGTERWASDLNLVIGGSSAITAFNLSSFGTTVTFAGVIGRDAFGDFVKQKLASGGVDLTGLRRTDAAKTGMTIWHTQKGKRAGVTYSGSIAMLEAQDLSDERLKSARHLHMGHYFLQTRLHPVAPSLFERAKQLGLTTSLDCNYDPAEKWDSNLKKVLPHIDLFMPNDDEALKITGKPDVRAAARELASLARTAVVKQGAKGAFIVSGTTELEVPAVPANVVETTGAGDSFNAGFLSEFLKGSSLEKCAAAGAIAGARCVGKVGGTTAFEN
jgi:sugar/nucleoside kinase (ribokinase family)